MKILAVQVKSEDEKGQEHYKDIPFDVFTLHIGQNMSASGYWSRDYCEGLRTKSKFPLEANPYRDPKKEA